MGSGGLRNVRGGCEGFVKEVRTDAIPAGGTMSAGRSLTGLLEAGKNPCGLGRGGDIEAVAVETEQILSGNQPVAASVERSREGRSQTMADVAEPREGGQQIDQAGAVLRVGAPLAGLVQGAQQGGVSIWRAVRESGPGEKDFVRRQRGKIRTGDRTPTGTGGHGHTVPRFADAKSVDLSGSQGGGHLSGRQDDEAGFRGRADFSGFQPLPQQKRFAGQQGAHGENRPVRLPGAQVPFQIRGGADALPEQLRAEGHRIATGAENETAENRRWIPGTRGSGPGSGSAESGEHRGRGVGSIQSAVEEAVADGSPPEFAGKSDIESMPGENAEFRSREEWRAVRHRHKTDPDPTALTRGGPYRAGGKPCRNAGGRHCRACQHGLCHGRTGNSAHAPP